MKAQVYFAVLLFAGACANEGVGNNVEGGPDVFQHVYDTKGVIPGTDYAPLDLDTIRDERSIAIENETYPLHIISYSLNDSSVINRFHDGTASVYHDRAFRLTLDGYGGAEHSVELDRSTFKDSLDAEFFERSNLYLVDDVFVRSNALYFNAYVGVPETDYVAKFHVQWFFRGPRTGTLRFIGPEFPSAHD